MSDQFVGEIRLFAFPRIPDGWLPCNGQSLSISTYQVLYALIGTTYGGDGVQTFNAPDLRGRVPINQGTGPGLSPRVLGQVAGQEAHTLLLQEMPLHSHALMSSTTVGSITTPGPTVHIATSSASANNLYAPQANVLPYDVMATTAIATNGSNIAHNNMMPTLTANYCIAYVGVFPSQG